jgi:hypothetical protein
MCRTEHAQDEKLEAAYQKYAHRQRQKSLVLVNLFDLCIKVIIILKESQRRLLPMKGVVWVLRQNVASHNVYVTKRNCY